MLYDQMKLKIFIIHHFARGRISIRYYSEQWLPVGSCISMVITEFRSKIQDLPNRQ